MVVKPGIGVDPWGQILNDALDELQSDADVALTSANTAQSTANTANSAASAAQSTATTASVTAASAVTTANAANSTANSASSLVTTLNTTVSGHGTRITDLETIVGGGGSILERPWEIRPATTSNADVQTAITTAMSGKSGDNVQRKLILPPGTYNLTTPLLSADASPGTVDWHVGLQIVGAGIGLTTINWNNAAQPFITASDPRLRFPKITGMTIQSQSSANVFAYLFSQAGGRYNQRWHLEDVKFGGTWANGFRLDGGATANLNSEFTFHRVETDPSSVWTNSFFHSGVTNATQENQFLNYWFYDCNFSLSSGTVFRFDRGGAITCINGSWSANDSSNTITWFNFPTQNSNNASATKLYCQGLRMEPKGSAHKILNSSWSNAFIHFESCSDIGSSQNAPSHDHERYTINGQSIWSGRVAPIVRFTNGAHGGYINYVASGGAQTRGGVIVDGCQWYRGDTGQKADEIQGGTQPILRWGGTAPNYDFTHGWNYDDLASWSVP